MDEVAELRRQLQELQRQREEEQLQYEEEQRQYEEEQRQYEEEQRQLQELRRQREEKEKQLQEKEKRFQELKNAALPQTLRKYLEVCHSFNLSIHVVTPPPYTTRGSDVTNPASHIFPLRIVPWDDFAARQEEIWNDLSFGDAFYSQPIFPAKFQLDYAKTLVKPIRSEFGLQIFEHVIVEAAVETLFARANEDPLLKSRLGLQGSVIFDTHSNLGEDGEPSTRKARGKGNRADEFLVYSTSNGVRTPALAIEYKPPHKLTVDQIITGLDSEIWPERDVINQDGDDFALISRRLVTVIITQLFSFLIGKGLQYGYVCTGEAFIFLHISDDPSTVYYSISIPSMDVMDDDKNRLHRTAAAQIFAFVLQAIRTDPPPEEWHDKAELLGLWEVEYDDILAKIPMSERKRKEPPTSPYRPQRWKGFKRSPIRTRSRCREPDTGTERPADEDEDPPSPTPNGPRLVRSVAVADNTASGETGAGKQGQGDQNQTTKPHIRTRPFCSQQCLLGLTLGKPIDRTCPNADDHRQVHINRLEFLRLVREQLAVDRGRDADCMPLYRSGSRGSLFKVRLSSHGYTLVAKGMESLDQAHLQHENEIYDRLLPLQGKYIPVCVGSIDLILPYYYDCGVFRHFMFLGWAGRPIFDYAINQIHSLNVADATTRIFKAIHKLRVLHRDAEPRNILYDEQSGNLMVVDFERSVHYKREQLGVSKKDRQGRKKHRELQKQKKLEKDREEMLAKQGISRPWRKREVSEGDFASELKWAVSAVSRCVAELANKG